MIEKTGDKIYQNQLMAQIQLNKIIRGFVPEMQRFVNHFYDLATAAITRKEVIHMPKKPSGKKSKKEEPKKAKKKGKK